MDKDNCFNIYCHQSMAELIHNMGQVVLHYRFEGFKIIGTVNDGRKTISVFVSCVISYSNSETVYGLARSRNMQAVGLLLSTKLYNSFENFAIASSVEISLETFPKFLSAM